MMPSYHLSSSDFFFFCFNLAEWNRDTDTMLCTYLLDNTNKKKCFDVFWYLFVCGNNAQLNGD